MAITKCRIWVTPVNRFTGAERELRQCGRTSTTLLWTEKIMSTNTEACELAELNDAELAIVSGGHVPGSGGGKGTGPHTGQGNGTGWLLYAGPDTAPGGIA